MKKAFFIILAVIFIRVSVFADEKELFLIVPGISVGIIYEKTTELDLIDHYGVENVRSTTNFNDQNVTVIETVLFPFDEMKKLLIIWASPDSDHGPAIVRIQGSNSMWHTAEGITLGTSLTDLETLNGSFFHLTGFNLVNPGEVTDCGDGKLKFLGSLEPGEEGIKGKSMILKLDQPEHIYDRVTSEEYQSVCIDSIFRSDNKVMEKLNPIVQQIDILFTK
jgi:hypothetical protein